jgi:hypothetical protein
MAKKSLLGNIIGEPKSPSSDTNSQKASDNLGTNNERKNETNGGGETPTVTIEKEKLNVTPIEKETPRPTPQETLIMSHPVKQEAIETKNVSGSIRISPDEMTYIDQLVKHKRMSGYTDYTKKEALSEALTLLMDKYPKEKLLS